MRGKPLNITTLIAKVKCVDWTRKGHYLKSMDNGWMDIWMREWYWLNEQLADEKDPALAHLRYKLSRGHNKLYLSKPEAKWLVEWLKTKEHDVIDPKYFV